MDNQCGRIIGGIYIALSSALSEESAQAAHDVLHSLGESPLIRPEDRRIYNMIVDAATRDIDELKAENEKVERQPRFEVITGGAA
jgi:hypothetical protein